MTNYKKNITYLDLTFLFIGFSTQRFIAILINLRNIILIYKKKKSSNTFNEIIYLNVKQMKKFNL